MALLAPRDRLVTLPDGVPELTLGWEAIHGIASGIIVYMEWKTIDWCPGYWFGSDGNICRKVTDETHEQHRYDDDDYFTVALRLPDGRQVRRKVNRLICEAFHGAPPGEWPEWHAAHEDHDKTNNTPGNLSWKTVQENSDAKMAAGRSRNQFEKGSVTEWPEETRRKISESLTGKTASEETRAKLRAARIGALRGPDGKFVRR